MNKQYGFTDINQFVLYHTIYLYIYVFTHHYAYLSIYLQACAENLFASVIRYFPATVCPVIMKYAEEITNGNKQTNRVYSNLLIKKYFYSKYIGHYNSIIIYFTYHNRSSSVQRGRSAARSFAEKGCTVLCYRPGCTRFARFVYPTPSYI